MRAKLTDRVVRLAEPQGEVAAQLSSVPVDGSRRGNEKRQVVQRRDMALCLSEE